MMWWDERGVRGVEGRRGRVAVVDLDCEYTRRAVVEAFEGLEEGGWVVRVTEPREGEEGEEGEEEVTPVRGAHVYWGEYERIDWDSVGAGDVVANCYCIRKGLIRKAQLALGVSKWRSKRPGSLLARCVPETHVFELYDIEYFDEVLIADVPELRDIKPEDVWILKPNITNQALGVTVFNDLDTLRSVLSSDEAWNLREWVVQRYVDRPLLVGGKKFHVRVYVLAVGAAPMTVYVHDDMLALFAAETYRHAGGSGSVRELSDLGAHLTNTCRVASDGSMTEGEESGFVKLFDEIRDEIRVEGAKEGIRKVVGECFEAVSSDLSFMPLPNCFELFGFDFMLDEDWGLWLLEANAEPDFKQTGGRLNRIIGDAIKGVYDKAVAPLTGAARGTGNYDGTKWRKVYEKMVVSGSEAVGFQVV
ncbi:tubulin--tyrosine ligase [Chloropicon primus]|uniref:Tubulin--tyrosine ligase n=2 Tax=Chloropicon primus TaxID=1764295 RepID=A0A5B8MKF8_9CHLO|nr:tubulin--tyrosine ligase [Chloropicon primus]UPQ99396.1 tubulin--tyrosine ligase [Chloropicon primus]|eukprot:QDZ20185.1 tubulin--tyrosine ligase [Chloropicon primus]